MLRAFSVLFVLLIAIAVLGLRRCEGAPPEIALPPEIVVGKEGRKVELGVADPGSGWRAIRVTLVHARGETPLLELHSPSAWLLGAATPEAGERFELALSPAALGLRDGSANLRVRVRDWSWRSFFQGNEAVLDVPVRIDLQPPRIAIANGLTYVKRGGSSAVVYTLSEEAERDGVEVGEAFFPGHPLDGGRRVALFAFPADAPRGVDARVVARDAAGNTGSATWAARLLERSFPDEPIALSRGFLERKASPLAAAQNVATGDPVEDFRRINTELRAANEARVRALLAARLPERLWRGAFQQMPNSQVTSRFAERRRYTLDGNEISRAIHYGYDLAATATAPVPAANAGRVVFADELGIYGNCVLIDHGLGVASLYGHLSSFAVSAGDRVRKGQTLGRSGETGLAGGDHLHFAILVGDTYVDPVEWWDPKWVRDHVEDRLAAGAP